MNKYFKCLSCGKIVEVIKSSSNPNIVCCNKDMVELKPNTVEAAVEKHQPVIVRDGNVVTVKVGEVAHPMLDNHYIEFIILDTKKSHQRVDLKPGDAPEAKFYIADDDEVLDALAYCNLHSLWLNK
jgi:superoxide reductase